MLYSGVGGHRDTRRGESHPLQEGLTAVRCLIRYWKYMLWTAEPVTKFLSVKSRSSGPQGSSTLSLSPEVTTNHSSMPHSLKYKSQIAIQSLSRDEVVNVITVLKRAPRLYSEPLPQNQKVLQHLEWQGTLVHLDRVWHQSQLNT